MLALLGREVHAAVADGEVEPTVRAEAQAVEVVAAQGDVDAVAGREGLDLTDEAQKVTLAGWLVILVIGAISVTLVSLVSLVSNSSCN